MTKSKRVTDSESSGDEQTERSENVDILTLYNEVMNTLGQLRTGYTFSDQYFDEITEHYKEAYRDDGALERLEAGEDFDAHMIAAKHFINSGKPLPSPLDHFVIGALEGKIKRNRRGVRISNNLERDGVIAAMVEVVAQVTGRPITRNDASSEYSACDLIKECLDELGFDLSYKAVAKIYNTCNSDKG